MKIILILVSGLCAYSLAIEKQEIFDNDKEDCIHMLKLDGTNIMKLDALDLPSGDDKDFNSFVACDSKQKGLMSEVGEVLFDKIEKLLLSSKDVKELNKIHYYIYKVIERSLKGGKVDEAGEKATKSSLVPKKSNEVYKPYNI
ncbi:hypothetical protein RN001_001643 [Aquatica leii]|uniref:Uncharacterized protein n=1 Tax=Aquatica leii TaxID=1421715 RepID=A0AAN7PG79_9COLE|nr:hypothetical protein RN001_001643 [Aquatica leii]